LPVVIASGSVLRHPTPGVLAQYLGLTIDSLPERYFDLVVVGRFMGPRPRPAEQNPPPEHGGRTGHKTWVQFRLRYVVLALLFVAFDMEMVFMFPWAVVYKQVGLVAFFDMFVFVAVLASASFFAWREGAFDWER
jgi:NADH:ubiquinone oxidoreductase subunit 3 (subunit A)